VRLRPLSASSLCALAIAVGGCGSDDPDTYEPGEPISAEVGESFEIVLDSNATTGYEWQLAGRPPGDVVSFDGSAYELDPGSEDREGGGGAQTLTFTAVGEGETTIDLEYVFTGGEQREPATTASSEVIVGPSAG
jgi:predicted secreted protein